MRTRMLFIFAVVALSKGVASSGDPSSCPKFVMACYEARVAVVVEMLRMGATVDCVMGKTPLPQAVKDKIAGTGLKFEHMPLMALCLPINEKEFVDPETLRRRSRLDKPNATDRVCIALILASHGCDLDAVSNRGETALHMAVRGRSLELAEVLIELGANVNAVTGIGIGEPSGRSALHYASWSEVLYLKLIQAGADPRIRDSAGRTPEEMFHEYRRQEKVYLPKK